MTATLPASCGQVPRVVEAPIALTVFLVARSSAASSGWRRALERAGIPVTDRGADGTRNGSQANSRGPTPSDGDGNRALALVSVVDRTDRDRIATLKRDHPAWPVLAIVSAGSSVRADALEAGADVCLPRDSDPIEIVAAVKALDRRCRSGDEPDCQEPQQAVQRLPGEFLEELSHELRAPLNTILGWAQILSGPMVDTPMMRRGLEAIERSAQTQAHLLNDVLDISRSLTGKLRVEKQPVDLGPVLDAAVDSIRGQAAAKQIDVIYMPLKQPAHVLADAERLQQVFWNLLSNAIKFTPLKGRIGVEASNTAASAEVRVVDSGMGIASDVLPHLFDGHQEGAAGKLGLGLAIVRHLVDVHAGTVTASSAGAGQGSIFTVTLPLQAPPPAVAVV